MVKVSLNIKIRGIAPLTPLGLIPLKAAPTHTNKKNEGT